ncbi:MAG: hypothetical protein LLG06_04505, partial [Desulfobacteraceae bacterium]|nr:hypothetical protein [Desulfobacteraceae bacterium]
LEKLKSAYETDELPQKEYRFLEAPMDTQADEAASDFPLLMLHGWADTLACRGPETRSPVSRIAEMNLVALGLFLNFPRFRRRREMETRFRELCVGFDQALGATGPSLGKILKELNSWFVDMTCRCIPERGEASVPTRDELLERAKMLTGTAPRRDSGVTP